jgi:hypothetical protein
MTVATVLRQRESVRSLDSRGSSQNLGLASAENSATPWSALAISIFILVSGSLVHVYFGDSYVGATTIYRGAHAWGSDDAYITYRYAQHLVEGKGLVFNSGERVEGYSSFLYLLLIATGFTVTDRYGIYVFSVMLNMLFATGAILAFYRIALARISRGRVPTAVLLFSACPSLWVWVAAGLETPLVLLLQLLLWLAVELYTDHNSRCTMGVLWILAGALTLSRADGFVFVAIVICYLGLRGHYRAALSTGAVLLLTFGTHIIWRHEYYGYLLPNTYYAKVSGPTVERVVSGFARLLSFGYFHYPSLAFYVTALMTAFTCWLRAVGLRKARLLVSIRFEFLAVFVSLVYWVWVGGDYFGDRFLLIIYPVGIVTTLQMMHQVHPQLVRNTLVAGLFLLQFASIVRSPLFTYRNDKYDYWIELGEYLRTHHGGQTIAVDAAGKVPFFSGLPTIDMLGLNDAFIGHKPARFFREPGHNKFDADYVLGRRPELIAAWLDRELNMHWGLERAKYSKAGYRPRYLIYTGLDRNDQNIVDVTGLDYGEMQELVDAGYVYGVLER